MSREDNRIPLLTRRAALFAGGQVALLATLAGRMYYLQVVQADRYAMLADENRINIRLVAPPRGRIVDRFGAILADNRPTYRVVLVAEQAGDIESTLKAVGTLIPVSETDRRRVLRDIRRQHSFVPVMIRENLSWEEMARIEVNTLELPGVSIEQGLIRHYPFGEEASHVLGYVAPVSEKELTGDDPLLELPDFRIGKKGIEKAYDLDLRGSAGTSQVEVNAFGRIVRELTREEGIAGQETVLSIDMALQEFAARRCAAEKSAACVLMDAWTGEVLAMVSSPGYDPSWFVSGMSQAAWEGIQNDQRTPLSNKAISGAYSPGSAFKPVVALAALEAGVITPETSFTCPGYFTLGDIQFHCWKKGGHGTVALRDAIKHSCDVYFYETGRRAGIDRMAAMATRMGLGAALGIDMPGERAGFPAIRVSPRDLRLVLDGMNAVVNEQGGTAFAARITEPGMQMGGKSGTSQVLHMTQAERERKLKLKDIAWERRDHALFISFAPVSAPRYVCAVVVEHGGETGGGGSAVAAPICRDVLLETQKRDPARRVPEHPFGAAPTVAQG